MRKIFVQFILLSIMLLFTSCLRHLICIDGDGHIATEVRSIREFVEIENFTEFDIVYTRSDTFGLAVTADRNLLDNISTEISGSVLEIETEPGNSCFNFTRRPVINVSSPYLSSIRLFGSGSFIADEMEGSEVTVKISGSGDIEVERIYCDDLTVYVSGSGDIDLFYTECSGSDVFISGSGDIFIEGVCDHAGYKISGSGNLRADSFITNTASVTISGSGDAFTHVLEKLRGSISGSGLIYVKGDPEIDVRISGSGRVIKN